MGKPSTKSNPRRPPSKSTLAARIMYFLLLSYEPKITWRSTVTFYFLAGLASLAYGLFVAEANDSIVEIVLQYDESCGLPSTNPSCTLTFDIPTKITQPVFLQYGLDNFFQNHRRWIESYSYAQLTGKDISLSEAISSCDPAVTNKDLGKTQSYGGVALDSTAAASPCGLKAKSYFNDEFELWNSTAQITLDETDISYPKGGNKFKKTSTSNTTQWINPENEHFIVWMTPASLSNFRKLWGKIHQDLEPGSYKMVIKNNYDVTVFNGKKYVILTNVSSLGGKNNFLSYTYFIAGVFFLVIAMFFARHSDLA